MHSGVFYRPFLSRGFTATRCIITGFSFTVFAYFNIKIYIRARGSGYDSWFAVHARIACMTDGHAIRAVRMEHSTLRAIHAPTYSTAVVLASTKFSYLGGIAGRDPTHQPTSD
jgi:hypothetical protein